jgi:hypothetical protein
MNLARAEQTLAGAAALLARPSLAPTNRRSRTPTRDQLERVLVVASPSPRSASTR